MNAKEREKIVDALWRLVTATRTSLKGSPTFEFTPKEVSSIWEAFEKRLSDSDFGHGENRYWQNCKAVDLIAAAFWKWALSDKLDEAREAVCPDENNKADEPERVENLRKIEAYLIEEIVRKPPMQVSEEGLRIRRQLGKIVHQTT